jgi:multidrug efflux pump subunit AcrA (membrane-fusion protein)
MTQLTNNFKKILRSFYHTVDDHPLQYFFSFMGVLLILIILSHVFQTPPKAAIQNERQTKEVEVVSIGKAPRIRLQAKVEKSGVIKITALTGGVVQQIYKHEGDRVQKGNWLFGFSTNYQGGVAQSVTRQVAEKNYQFLSDTYDSQKEVIAKNREIATKAESQAAELRDINFKSIDETNTLISLNNNVLSMMDQQLSVLDSINVNGSSNSAILSLKQGKSQVLAALNQAHAAVRTAEYQTNGDNEPGAIARAQRDATLKQLDIQEKTLDLNKEISLLNLRLTQIQEAIMYPAAPFGGVIERINVKVGQNVTSGTVLATMTGTKNTASIIVNASGHIASSVSRLEASTITVGNTSISAYPTYISSEPTDGTLHSIIFSLPEEEGKLFTNDQVITVDMPIGAANSSSTIPFIPLDAIYQTDTQSFIYVVQADKGVLKAISKIIKLGDVTGDYVEVKNGLSAGDKVILDRNIVEGDTLKLVL